MKIHTGYTREADFKNSGIYHGDIVLFPDAGHYTAEIGNS